MKVIVASFILKLSLILGIPLLAQDEQALEDRITIDADGRLFEQIDDMLLPLDGTDAFSAQRADIKKWPNGIIPVVFSPDYTTQERAIFFDACEWWSEWTRVKCVLRTNETSYVQVNASTNINSSAVGKVGGRQVMNIASRFSKGVIAHELAHALGFAHQHNADNRDKFVKINLVNIKAGKAHNFDKLDESINFGGYDFCSVMHYPQKAFSKNNLNTIDILVSRPACTPGQRSYLSDGDKLGMIAAYGQDSTDPRLIKVPNLIGKAVGYTGSSDFWFERYGFRTHVIEKTDNGRPVDYYSTPRIYPTQQGEPIDQCASIACDTRVTWQFPAEGTAIDFGTVISLKINRKCEPWNRC